MALVDRVADLAAPLLETLDLRLYDVELNGGTLRITIESDDGLNLDQVADATRLISRAFDDDDPMPGKYTLEVSSPGLERRLRTPAHFEGALDEMVSIKLAPHVEGDRRLRGVLSGVSHDSATVTADDDTLHEVAFADITKATTVFEWGPSPKPGSKEAKNAKAPNAARSPEASTDANTTTTATDAGEPAAPKGPEPSDSERRAPAR